MAEDRKRRARSQWDDAKRATWGRGRTEPGAGIPIEVEHDETTPPPREPPTAEVFDTLPPPAQMRALRNVVAEQAAAIDRVWDARHVSERLDRLESVVTEDTNQITRLIVEVHQWAETSKAALGKSNQISDNQIALDTRLGVFFDEQFPEFVGSLKEFVGTLNGISTRVADVEGDIEQLKTKQAEHAIEIVGLKASVLKIEAADKESLIRSDERRRWFSYVTKGRAALVGVGAVVAVVITQAKAIWAWLNH